MRKAQALFGPDAFRLTTDFSRDLGPFSKALFDIWSVALIRYQADEIERNREAIRKGFLELMNNDSEFIAAISDKDDRPASITIRFSKIEQLGR